MELRPSGEYLEEIGWGPYNLKVFFQCGVAWASDMIWSANIAYILEGSALEFGMSAIEIGLLGSCFPFGLMIGAFVWGLVGDKFGRMHAFKSTVCISTFFSLLLTLSVHPAMSGIALIFLGFGIGGELSLGGTVFCEFCPPSKAYYLTILAVFWGLGGTISALIAFITVMTNNTSIYDWRFIVGSSFVIEVFCMIFRFFMEETPAFSILSGQIDKTEKILNNISVQNTGKEFFLDTRLKGVNKESICSNPGAVGTKSSKDIIKKLFSGENLRLVIIFGVMYFSASFAYTSILYFMPQLLSSMSTPMAYAVILIQQACGIPGTIIGSKLVETKLGRKFTIVFSFALAFLCCFLFYINQSAAAVNDKQIITCTSILNLVVIMGYSAVYTITPESYKTEVRNLGVGAAGICARIAAIICPILTGWLLAQNGGFEIALIIFAALFGLAGAAALPLKDTRPVAGDKNETLRSGH